MTIIDYPQNIIIMERIIEHIRGKLKKYDVDFLRFVDISDLSPEVNRGCGCAVLFGIPLPGDFIRLINVGEHSTYNWFDILEERVKRLADFIADYLVEQGYTAYSQSEEEQLRRQTYDESVFRSRLPHKTLAVRAGLGWIGKNDLCNFHDYGCAVSMCSVLTDAPFESVHFNPQEPKCGKCNVCRDICPTSAISGTMWHPEADRDELIDTSKCILCLKCLAGCPFTKSKRKSQ